MPRERDYWFPAKRYGWGWGPPVTWQGWLISIVWLAGVFAGGARMLPTHPAAFAVFVFLMCCLLTLICYLTGEPPRWRNGE